MQQAWPCTTFIGGLATNRRAFHSSPPHTLHPAHHLILSAWLSQHFPDLTPSHHRHHHRGNPGHLSRPSLNSWHFCFYPCCLQISWQSIQIISFMLVLQSKLSNGFPPPPAPTPEQSPVLSHGLRVPTWFVSTRLLLILPFLPGLLCSGQKTSSLFFNLTHTLPSAALCLQGSLACHALQQLSSESPLKSQFRTPHLKQLYLPPWLLSPSLTSYIPLAYLSALPKTREGSSAAEPLLCHLLLAEQPQCLTHSRGPWICWTFNFIALFAVPEVQRENKPSTYARPSDKPQLGLI